MISYIDQSDDENRLESCRSIAHFLSLYCERDNKSLEIRDLLLRDLCWRASSLDPLDKAIVMAESSYSLLPKNIKAAFTEDSIGMSELGTLMASKKQRKDVGIITVVRPELRAVLSSLGRNTADLDLADKRSDGFLYWFADVDRYHGPPLSVVVTLVGEPRNVPCAIAVEHVLGDYDVDLLMLVGIAAGPREKVKLGDAVAAERVYDYEHVRLELFRLFGIPLVIPVRRPRPDYRNVDKEVQVALERYDGSQMQTFFRGLLSQSGTADLPNGMDSTSFLPDFHRGTIAAGEKLIADGTLSRMFRKIDQEIRAGDQEDNGFALAAEHKKIKWCIFRGIADYGDPTKAKNWQFVAALSAASAAITFLRSVWKNV